MPAAMTTMRLVLLDLIRSNRSPFQMPCFELLGIHKQRASVVCTVITAKMKHLQLADTPQ